MAAFLCCRGRCPARSSSLCRTSCSGGRLCPPLTPPQRKAPLYKEGEDRRRQSGGSFLPQSSLRSASPLLVEGAFVGDQWSPLRSASKGDRIRRGGHCPPEGPMSTRKGQAASVTLLCREQLRSASTPTECGGRSIETGGQGRPPLQRKKSTPSGGSDGVPLFISFYCSAFCF